MKKPLTILLLLALVCAGCVYMAGRTKEVNAPGENVHDAEESAVIASEEQSKEGGADIVAGTGTGQHTGEETIAEDKLPTKEIAAEEAVVMESEEQPKEEGEADIAAVTGQHTGEETIIENETVPTEETAGNVETAATTEENKLCVGLAKEIYEETNKERVAAGLPELEWSDELAEAADVRAEEIIPDEHFSHVRPDGTKCYALSDRIHGENIGRGPHATGAEFVQHWMDSEGHKWNILCDKYTMIGVGTRYTEMGDTAVQIFGY